MDCTKDEATNAKLIAECKSAPSRAVRFSKFGSRKTLASKNSQKRCAKVARCSTPSAQTHARSHQRTNAFWTICHRRNMQYEYPTMYCNRNLHCWNCEMPFIASEKSPATIWTSRRICNMRSEYHKIYCNRTILCTDCRESFVAAEVPQPV